LNPGWLWKGYAPPPIRAWSGNADRRENRCRGDAMNLVLVFAGILCVLLGSGLFYKTVPREGKPESAWTKTEGRVITTVMSVLILVLGGIVMFLKGIL
jgi:hypothetical protein